MMVKTFLVNEATGDLARVHVQCLVNAEKIRHEQRHGRDVIIVPSATMPDDVIMNQVRYPAEEIASSFMSLDRKPAPFGHPTLNGAFVSATDPEALNMSWIGAHNENVRREGGRVLLDKVIDVEVAKQSENGRAVLNAIEKGDPIHTSTGLLCHLKPAPEGADYKHTAFDIRFDHDAILLKTSGAATPEQGVGMLVNAEGGQQEIMVLNSVLARAEEDLDWACERALEAFEKQRRAPLVEQLKALMKSFMGETLKTNEEDDDGMVDETQIKSLNDKVTSLEATVNGIGDVIANAVAEALKPLNETVTQLNAQMQANEAAELEQLRGRIVKANLMNEEAAKTLPLEAARALAGSLNQGAAAALNAAAPSRSAHNSFKAPAAEG